MGITGLIKKRQAGAPERKAKREELKALELKARQHAEERIRKAKEKKAKKEAILRGQQKARGKDFKKIGKAVGKGITRVAKATLAEKKPKGKSKVKKVPTRKAKPPTETRKFNGKVYKLESVHSTKALANKTATRLRNAKKLVRTVKTREGYFVYARKR